MFDLDLYEICTYLVIDLFLQKRHLVFGISQMILPFKMF